MSSPPITFAALSARRDAEARSVTEAERALAVARARLAHVTAALAALDAAADLSGTLSAALVGMRVSGREISDYYRPSVKSWDDGGEIGDMWRAVLAFLVGDTDDRARSMYATCKNYDRWHNQYCGIDPEPHSPRHGTRSWTVTLRPMDGATREACIAIVRAVLAGRIKAGTLADASRAVAA